MLLRVKRVIFFVSLIALSVLGLSGCYTVVFDEVLEHDKELFKKLEGKYVSVDENGEPKKNGMKLNFSNDTCEIEDDGDKTLCGIEVEKIGTSLILMAHDAEGYESGMVKLKVGLSTASLFKYQFTKEGTLEFFYVNPEFIKKMRSSAKKSVVGNIGDDEAGVCFFGKKDQIRKFLEKHGNQKDFWTHVDSFKRVE